MASGDTKTESYLRTAAEGTRADLPSDNCCNTKTQNLIVGVANRIMDVEDEVEELKNNPDVVDIVDTYQDLQDYDTSTLTDKDIIRVLQDSTHSGNSTYYRWNATTNQFDFVGEVASGSGDTVYSDKTTSASATGGAVYIGNLNANQEEQSDPTTTDRNWKYFWALPYDNSITPTNNSVNILGDIKSSAHSSIAIGYGISQGATVYGARGVAIGGNAESGQFSVALGDGANAGTIGSNRGGMIAIGNGAKADVDKAICVGGGGSNYGVLNSASTSSVALGYKSSVGDGATGYKNSVALGAYSKVTRQGEVNVGLVTDETTGGYNDTAYRIIGGVHDPVDTHDAATKGYVDAHSGGGGGTTYTAGDGIDITDKTISVDTDTIQEKLTAGTNITISDNVISAGGGGSITPVQTTGTSTTDVMSQNATSSMVFADPGTDTQIKIGANTSDPGTQGILIGNGTYNNNVTNNNMSIGASAHCHVANTYDCIAFGDLANVQSHSAIAIGRSASVGNNLQGSIALGAYSTVTRKGEINVGTSWNATGFNNTAYRVIGGVHDGQNNHDAATVAQGNTLATSAPTTSTVGVLGQLYTDTTNMHTYQCTAISGDTYTWQQRW